MQNDMIHYAYDGIETMVEEGPLRNIVFIAGLYTQAVRIIVDTSSGIEDIEDLIGKRVSWGIAGSGIEETARKILKVCDISVDNLSVSYIEIKDSLKGIENKTLDAVFINASDGKVLVSYLAKACDISLLSLSDDNIKELSTKYGFYEPYIIKGAEKYCKEIGLK